MSLSKKERKREREKERKREKDQKPCPMFSFFLASSKKDAMKTNSMP